MAKKKSIPDSLTVKAGRREIPITIEEVKGDKEGATETFNGRLREMDGDLRASWLTFARSREIVEPNGMTTIKDFKDYHATLISKCMIDNESKKYVSTSLVNQKLSQSALMEVYRMCCRMNDFAVPGEDEEGRCPHCLKTSSLMEFIKCGEEMEGEKGEGKEENDDKSKE